MILHHYLFVLNNSLIFSENKNKILYIYALADPITKEIKYIGKSINPEYRLKKHISSKKENEKSKWIKYLKTMNLNPKLIILEECQNDGGWESRERFWISYYKSVDSDLFNLTNGGEGLKEFSEKTRQQMSEKLRQNWQDPEYRAKMSKSRKLKWQDPKYRQEMIEIHKNREKPSKKTREKLSEKTKLRWQNEEFRKRRSEQSKMMWENLDYRQNHYEKNKGKHHISEESKRNISIKAKLRWQNEEFRQNTIQKMKDTQRRKK